MVSEPHFSCTACQIEKPASEFGTMKRRGRVERMRECRVCKRERDRAAYANQPKRRDQIAQNRRVAVEKAHDAVTAHRSGLSCTDCNASGATTKLSLYRGSGKKPVANLVRDGLSVERVIAEAKDGIPLCEACLGRRSVVMSHKARHGERAA